MFSVADLAATDLSTLDAMRARRLAAQGDYGEMAMQLNAWMCDDERAAKYREIYGREWSPVEPDVDGLDEAAPDIAEGTERFTRSVAQTL